MTKTAIVFSCAHSKPSVSNERFNWLGKLIYDVRPDYVVDLGDTHDMHSLNQYDSGKPGAPNAKSYQADIEHAMDAQERLWHIFSHYKRKRPTRYGIEGNHEHRIRRSIALDPRLEGEKYGISFDHLETNRWYDEYIEYEDGAPGGLMLDGVLYSHFVQSGNMGRALEGKHHAHALVDRLGCSVTVGHSHKFSHHYFGARLPRPSIGLVAGCMKGAREHWAGQSQDEWRHGAVIKHALEGGVYDLEWVSLGRMEKNYG